MGHQIIIDDKNSGDFFYREAIKTLRANIQFAGRRRRVILITSVFSGEGKSDTTFHLAAEMAGAGKKVLMIDADIRNSMLVNRFGIEQSMAGLSEYLSGQVETEEEIIYSTNYDNLDIIIAGAYAPNPAEMLSDTPFEDLLKKEAEKYDYIFIDSPPLGQVIDAAMIAQFCNGAIMVIESGAVSYRAAQKVKEQLERTGCTILGVVLNRV